MDVLHTEHLQCLLPGAWKLFSNVIGETKKSPDSGNRGPEFKADLLCYMTRPSPFWASVPFSIK